jgi:hypothetical protein
MKVGKLGATEIVLPDTLYEIYKLDDANSFSVVTINALNRGIDPCKFDIGIKDSNGDIAWIEYKVEVQPKNVLIRTGVNLSTGDVIVVSSTNELCNIVITGSQSSNNLAAVAFPQLINVDALSAPTPASLATFGASIASNTAFEAYASPGTESVVVNTIGGALLTSVTSPIPSIGFGESVAITNFYLFVGAPENSTTETLSGSVFVYETFTGTLVAEIQSPTPVVSGNFGTAIAVDDTNGLLFISEPGATGGTGAVHRIDLGTFAPTLTNPIVQGVSVNTFFGSNIKVRGTEMLVQAPGNGGLNQAAVYLIDTVTMDYVIGGLFPGVAPTFGSSLAIANDFYLIGDPDATVNSFPLIGSAHVFDKITKGLITSLEPRNTERVSGMKFGQGLGTTSQLIFVGAPGVDNSTGKVYSFLSNTFEEVADVTHPEPQVGALFGSVISATDAKTLVAAPEQSILTNLLAGKTYVYRRNTNLFTTRSVTGTVTSSDSEINQGSEIVITVSLNLPYADNGGFEIPWSISGYTDVVTGATAGVGTTIDGAGVGTFDVTIQTKTFEQLDFTGEGPQEIVFTSYGNSITLTVVPKLPSLYDFTSAKFTPGGQYGSTGPSLVQARSGLVGTGVDTWKTNTEYFNTSAGIQLWTVPQDGDYTIETWGARGGNGQGNNYFGGYGSRMKGTFTLVKGDVLKILVGQQGASSYGGGGGMTAVATTTNTPLIVSGGGNPTSPWSSTIVHATTNTTGQSGSGYAGGTNGNGGTTGAGVWGGAGFLGNATGNANCSGNIPQSFVNGGAGGTTCNGFGGFGGGSGTDGCCYGASGAGGGYSGGGGTSGSSQYGGAGGSYNTGEDQSNENGNLGTATLNGPGQVIITLL